MPAWNNWFHCNGNTFGTGPRGDSRGWRSRKHHEHVEGDYKNPLPNGKYKREYEHSKRLMKRKEVDLPLEAREIACRVMVESLLFRKVEVIALSVGKRHWHSLCRFVLLDLKKSRAIAIAGFARNRTPRVLMGVAKKRAARALSEIGLVDRGGVWGGRCGVKSIADRKHELKAASYILDHRDEGAYVYYLGKFLKPRRR